VARSRHIILVERGRRGDPFALWRLYEIVGRKAMRSRLNLLLEELQHARCTLFQSRNAADSGAAPSSVRARWRAARPAAHTEMGLRSLNCAPADTVADWCIQVVPLAGHDCGRAAARPPASADHTPDSSWLRVSSAQVAVTERWPWLQDSVLPQAIVAESVPASAVAAD
jgi:hypothetical protein